MKIKIDRNSEICCFAADVQNYARVIDIEKLEELDQFLFGYLPHKDARKANVWSIVLSRGSKVIPYAYFIDGNCLRWIEHTDKVGCLEENDSFFCEFHDNDYHPINEPKDLNNADLLSRVKYKIETEMRLCN